MICNRFLRTLSSDALETVSPFFDRITVASGRDLYLPGDEIKYVYFPESGLVSLISVMENGDQVETAIVGREGAVGMIEASGSGRMLYRAVVQLDLEAIRVPVRRYLSVFDTSPALRHAVSTHLELTIAEGRQILACQTHHLPSKRLAWWLLECQDRTGLETIELTQEFLGAMLGVQRTAVTKSAAQLRKHGVIDYRRGSITITDRPGLETRACECYATIAGYRQLIERVDEGLTAPQGIS